MIRPMGGGDMRPAARILYEHFKDVNLNSKRPLGPQIVRRLLTQDCLLCARAAAPACSARPVRPICRDCQCTRCPRCALPTPHGESVAAAWPSRPTTMPPSPLFRYAFPIDKLVQSFKYGHRLALASYFGRQLAALLSATPT
jgi:predicted amidophosphoribosyltransferase